MLNPMSDKNSVHKPGHGNLASGHVEKPQPTFRHGVIFLVLLIAILVPLLNTIPTWHGYMSEQAPDRVFLGFRNMPADHYQYASFIRQAADEGRFLMEDRFTSEEHSARFILLYFWLTGMASRISGLSVVAVWEIMRVAVGAAFLLTAWRFSGHLFQKTEDRLLAYFLVAFSGGIGWLLRLMTGRLTPDLAVTPADLRDAFDSQWNWNTFGSMTAPHWVAASFLFLLCAVTLAGNSTPRKNWAIGLILPPLIWFLHPYTAIAAYLAFGLFAVMPLTSAIFSQDPVNWRAFRDNLAASLPFILSFAIVAAYLLWARKDPVYAATSSVPFLWNPTYSVFMYIFGYGLLLPLAWFGIKWSNVLPTNSRQVLFSWLASAFLLATNPFLSGVKFQYLLHLPLALLAALGLVELRRRSTKMLNMTRGISGLFLGGLLFSASPLGLIKDVPATATDTEIYLSTSEISALRFLDNRPQGIVLSLPWIGNRIAWLSNKKVYVGHWFLTLNLGEKTMDVQTFLNPLTNVEAKRDFLRKNSVRYIYYGREESSAGEVAQELGLPRIYDGGGIVIYQVSP